MYLCIIHMLCMFVCADDEEDLVPPPGEIHSRKSIAEKDDQLPPLRPMLPSTRRGGFRKPFISTHSDAADSAVSMVCAGAHTEKYVVSIGKKWLSFHSFFFPSFFCSRLIVMGTLSRRWLDATVPAWHSLASIPPVLMALLSAST